MARRENRQVFLCQFEELNGWPQTPTVFRVRWLLEVFLQMHKRAGRLNQAFEKIIVRGVVVEPELFQNIVSLVIALLVPAAEERAVKRMVRHHARKIDIVAFELAHEARNPLAFAHVGLNLTEAQMSGKPRRFAFPEGRTLCRNEE